MSVSDERYINRGVSLAFFLPTIAGSVATRAEIEAGVVLHDRMADIAGFMIEGSEAEASDWSSDFDKKAKGTRALADSSLTFHAKKTGTDAVRVALPEAALGYVVIMNAGDIPTTGKMNQFPIQVRSVGDVYSFGSDTAKFRVQFSPTDEPTIGATIPASS
jgi:hypothetical protein